MALLLALGVVTNSPISMSTTETSWNAAGEEGREGDEAYAVELPSSSLSQGSDISELKVPRRLLEPAVCCARSPDEKKGE